MNASAIRKSFLTLGMAIMGSVTHISSASDPPGPTVFCGSSPCGDQIRQAFPILTNGEPELIEWKLTLYQDARTKRPARYDLRCQYGLTAPGKPGLSKDIKTLERQGTCKVGKGTKSNPDAVVYELEGAVSLLQVDADILQVLNPDRSLMVGNGGWSYTLYRAEHAEKPPDAELALSQPSMSYKISSLATGPTVFGVFEGRSPCQGIARELKIPVPAGSTKAKWRVTLFQHPQTTAPTTYKVEGSLFRDHPREGTWTRIRGTEKDPNATVYRLEPTRTEPALLLLKGDDDVLYLLDQNRNPLVGHCEFSYTLNRRNP